MVLLGACIRSFVQSPYIGPIVPVVFTDAVTRVIMFLLSAFYFYELVSVNRFGITVGAAIMVVLTVLYPVPAYMLLTVLSLITMLILWKNRHSINSKIAK